MASAQCNPTTVADVPRAPVSEQTPLLGDQTPDATVTPQESEVPVAEEPTTKELLLVLGSIWIGVFLAALGMSDLFRWKRIVANSNH